LDVIVGPVQTECLRHLAGSERRPVDRHAVIAASYVTGIAISGPPTYQTRGRGYADGRRLAVTDEIYVGTARAATRPVSEHEPLPRITADGTDAVARDEHPVYEELI
jgi:hypothetical protein